MGTLRRGSVVVSCARDDYPILSCVAVDRQLFCWTEAKAALREIDELRRDLAKAQALSRPSADEARGERQ